MFETQVQIWIYLINGGRIRHRNWGPGQWLGLHNGFVVDERGFRINFSFSEHTVWERYDQEASKV